jgi:hypothetical protein
VGAGTVVLLGGASLVSFLGFSVKIAFIDLTTTGLVVPSTAFGVTSFFSSLFPLLSEWSSVGLVSVLFFVNCLP